jgi:hypothetical protein
VAWLRRRAHTLRLEGDHVEAQAVEHDTKQLLSAPAEPRPLTARRRPGVLIWRRSALQPKLRRPPPGHGGNR